MSARPRWLRPLLNPVLVRIFSREVRRRLQGLRDYVERDAESAGPERRR